MDFGLEALELLRTERGHLLADLAAIDAGKEPWIPGRDVDRLRKRLALLEALIADHEQRAKKINGRL